MKIQIAIVYFVARHANEQARSGSARIGEEPARIGIALARHMRAARGRSTPDSPVDRSGAPRADERYASARARDTRDTRHATRVTRAAVAVGASRVATALPPSGRSTIPSPLADTLDKPSAAMNH
ncbi:hypothetical protein [Burkholderia pseudomallei]|uniref:hypothetical protein n=1 Tax=Burkholderia pseudomallei TaxID=28450 RepID=UPI001CC2EAB9|nr:hypothetical protein [Burkholderia pseudomallei]